MFEKYCPICGIDVNKENEMKRFGKYFCSEEHAQQFVEKRQIEQSRAPEERKRPRRSSC